MPIIESYSFGRIVIDGRKYTSDVILFPDRVNDSWWRREGHCLAIEDLSEVLHDPPEMLVIGTGSMGLMRVPEETINHLKKQGIEVITALTPKAIKIYNQMQAERKTVAALHLTC